MLAMDAANQTAVRVQIEGNLAVIRLVGVLVPLRCGAAAAEIAERLASDGPVMGLLLELDAAPWGVDALLDAALQQGHKRVPVALVQRDGCTRALERDAWNAALDGYVRGVFREVWSAASWLKERAAVSAQVRLLHPQLR